MDPEQRVGTVLRGKWTLERLLGAGGMAAVYSALHKIGRRDAIKILHPEIASDADLRARFDQEAYAVNRFVHPGAVEIRDIDVTEDGCPFLVMELLEGESLWQRCHQYGPPQIDEALRIADSVLDVLSAAHAQGIVHRDIKPDNLFCLPDGRIKVLDFGVARVRQAALANRTRTGTTLGTISYMPPEQVMGMDVDHRADVFAVGATLFRLIANRRIHEASTDVELAVKMATEPAPPLASVAPHAPPHVCAIVDRALAFDRDARYPSASAMQEDIRAVRQGQPPAIALGSATVAKPPPPPEPAPPAFQPVMPARTALRTQLTRWTVTTVGEKRLRWVALALPIVGAAVVALVFYLVTRVDRDEPKTATAKTSVAPPATTTAATSKKTATPVATAPVAPTKDPEPDESESESEAETKPSAKLNCFLTNDCAAVCEKDCDVKCESSRGCSIGARHDSAVRCLGPNRCDVSCAGKCKVKCDRRAPCIAYCTPGFECELEDCPSEVETCSPFVLACGTPCPE